MLKQCSCNFCLAGISISSLDTGKELSDSIKEKEIIALGTASRYKETLSQQQAEGLSVNSRRHAVGSEGSSRECKIIALQKYFFAVF